MTIKLELSEAHFQAIIEALGDAPFKKAAPVMNELARQTQQTQQPITLPQEVKGNGDAARSPGSN